MPALSIARAKSISMSMYIQREQIKMDILLKNEKSKDKTMKLFTSCPSLLKK